MEYFWKQYEDLPEGLGYGRFSPEHWMTLAVVAGLILCAALLFRRMDRKGRERVLLVIPFVMIALEIGKDLFLCSAHRFDVGYLPLHMCSLGVFVFLLSALAKGKRWKGIFGEIAVTLILPGSVAALLFPDWAHLYPVWNFMNLYGYAWHGFLVLYPILCLLNGQVHPSIRHIHYDLLFLLCTVPPVYVFDRAFHTNYMFVNWPPKGTPLELIASVTGPQWYLAGYALFSAAVILGVYLIIEAAGLIRRRRGKGNPAR
ncbi:MAG: YwaF family protein [Firmicutes bacterium]|nr:YwaF family protein [Bacillota bacterium]